MGQQQRKEVLNYLTNNWKLQVYRTGMVGVTSAIAGVTSAIAGVASAIAVVDST